MLSSENKRIVYIGAERVGLACLQQLLALGKRVVGVFTAEETLRLRIADFISFEPVAATGVPVIPVTSTQAPEVVEQIRALRPDLILAISWSQRIPKALLELPPLGCVGLHYSLLPARRGGAPLNWALIDGLCESGVTLFYLDDGLDTGDLIGQRRFAIDRADTVKTLLDKVVVLAPQLLAAHIDDIEQGRAPRTTQDPAAASSTPRRQPEDSRINGIRSLEELYNFIRALSPPYPSAFTYVAGRKLVIPSARFEDGKLWIEGYLE